MVSSQPGSAPLSHARSAYGLLNGADEHTSWSGCGAGDRDRTGMASLEGSVTPAINALVRALVRWTSCLPRALRAIRWTNCSTGFCWPHGQLHSNHAGRGGGSPGCIPARLGLLTRSVSRVGGRGRCGSSGAAIQSDAANFIRSCLRLRKEARVLLPYIPEAFGDGRVVFQRSRDEVPSRAVLVDQVAAEQP